MLFKESLAQQIITGNKTQTRRPQKDGEKFILLDEYPTVLTPKGHIKWQKGREYSVQYGRGLPTRYWLPSQSAPVFSSQNELVPYALYELKLMRVGTLGIDDEMRKDGFIPLKIRIAQIWQEDVRTISHEDAIAEGFSCVDEFLCTWAEFYDKKILAGWFDEQKIATWVPDGNPHAGDVVPFSNWLIENRPAHLYQAWALKFELVTN